MRRIRIVEPGLLSTVQDRGRFGHSASGVGPAGAADTLSLRTGNRLLGNDENAAAIEMTLRGATIAFEDDAVVCLVGGTAPQAKLSRDGTERPLGMWSPTPVRAGSTLAIGPIRASDLPVVVSPAFGDVNVIGMNMLSRLKSWGVQDGEMVLTP